MRTGAVMLKNDKKHLKNHKNGSIQLVHYITHLPMSLFEEQIKILPNIVAKKQTNKQKTMHFL